MLPKEAHDLVTKKYTESKAISCWEFASGYMFQIVPKDFDMTEDPDTLLDSDCFVDKKTGEVSKFNPLDIPIEEYKRGHEIKNFK